MPRNSSLRAIKNEEWDFRALPLDRLGEALVYEYARSEKWLTEVVKQCVDDISDATHYKIPSVDLYAVRRRIEISPARRQWAAVLKQKVSKETNEGRDVPNSRPGRLTSVVEIWARREPRPGPYNPFVHHDRVVTLGTGFPQKPYLLNPSGFAVLHIHEGIPILGVHDLKAFQMPVSFAKDSPIWRHHDSPFRDKAQWIASEKNGLPIDLSRNDPFWHKFALAIDFSRTDEDLQVAFSSFLKDARKEYKLPLPGKQERPTRGGIPDWITARFCQDSLNVLGAHRLIEHFGGNVDGAFRYAQERLEVSKANGKVKNWSLNYGGKKEFRRAAEKYRQAAAKLFGDTTTVTA